MRRTAGTRKDIVPHPSASEIDLPLLERWLIGWSLSRGLPLPVQQDGALTVEVGWPDQLRRHVFLDAGAALQACAREIQAPFVYVKAAVPSAQLRQALPARWQIESPRYIMRHDGPMPIAAPPAGFTKEIATEHGARVVRFIDTDGKVAASGGLVVYQGTAVFDRIETATAHRRRGLGRAVMGALEQLARDAGASKRLLIATEAGRSLYLQLGWQELGPWSTAVLPAPLLPGQLNQQTLLWQHDAGAASALPIPHHTSTETP